MSLTADLISSGYPYSTRDNLAASASQALKRLIDKGEVTKDGGQYYEAEKK